MATTIDAVWRDAVLIMTATRDARERTGDHTIGATVRKGQYSIVSVSYPAGRARSVVVPLTDYMPFSDAIEFLNSMRVAV